MVGVVTAKLDAIAVAGLTGDIPQNVNFAINAADARKFMDIEGVEYETAPSEASISAADVAAEAREFTVLIERWE